MIPWLIIAVIAVPALVIVFAANRPSTESGKQPLNTSESESEREFAEAEAYEERWREEERKHPRESLY